MPRGPRTGHAWRQLVAQVKREESVCRLCGRWVDKTLPGTHRWGPTLHHLRALNRGGALLDRANAGLAHLHCNAKHGDGSRSHRRGLSRPRVALTVTQRQW
jgi:hypothetical protein